jgi:hypothetical protein
VFDSGIAAKVAAMIIWLIFLHTLHFLHTLYRSYFWLSYAFFRFLHFHFIFSLHWFLHCFFIEVSFASIDISFSLLVSSIFSSLLHFLLQLFLLFFRFSSSLLIFPSFSKMDDSFLFLHFLHDYHFSSSSLPSSFFISSLSPGEVQHATR